MAMKRTNYLNVIVFVLLLCGNGLNAVALKDASAFKSESSAVSKSFTSDLKRRQAEELAKIGGKKADKKIEAEMRFKSLIQYRLDNFKSPVGTTPETIMLYTSLTNLLNEMKDINSEINFLSIEVEETKNTDNTVTRGLKIMNAYGEDVTAKEALSDMYVLKSRIRAMRADRAAVGVAITLVTLKIASGIAQAVSGALSAINGGTMSEADKQKIQEGTAIVAQLSADLGMNSKSLNDLNRFIKDETDRREAAIDQHIENIKAMGGELGKLRF